MARIKKGGFTLVEVIVALAIAASSLILLVSAGRASLLRSSRSTQSARIDQFAESKLAEVCSGLEAAQSGHFEESPGWSWHVRSDDVDVGELKKLEKVTVMLSGPGGAAWSVSTLRYNERKKLQP